MSIDPETGASEGKKKRLEAIIQGRVQGVGFRYFVMDHASRLQLVGVCRNLRCGDVQVVAEGPEGALEALLVALHRGPTMSRVDKVHVVWRPPTQEFTSFSLAPTR